MGIETALNLLFWVLAAVIISVADGKNARTTGADRRVL